MNRGLCTRKDPCPFSVTGKHPCEAQRVQRGSFLRFTLNELYSMPQALTDDIAKAAAVL